MDLGALGQRIKQFVWGQELSGLPPYRRSPLRVLQVVWVLVGDLMSGQLSLHAMSLVYTTLLSLVPLLALTFSVLKGFGVHNQLEPALVGMLEPLGEKGLEIARRILEFVENVRVGVLGSIGLALLLYTVISLLSKIEQAFNYIWQVARPRSLGQRFSEYLSVLLIGPVLIFAALGITATMMNNSLVHDLAAIEPFGTLIQFGAKLLPYVLVISAFTFFYVFMPNTRVRLSSALTGGLVAGVLWQTTGWVFGSIVVKSTNYTAIYSSFAILIIFMIWLFANWLILLFGASVAFYKQHPENLVPERLGFRLSNRLREKVALLIMFRIGDAFYRKQAPPTLEQLARWLNIPSQVVQRVVAGLQRQHLLIETCNDRPGYAPGLDFERLPLVELLGEVRRGGENDRLNDGRLPVVPAVDQVLEHFGQALAGSLGKRNLREMIVDAAALPAAEIRVPSTESGSEDSRTD